jgi:hypothetical protein
LSSKELILSLYNFETCADIDTLNFAHKMAIKPFSDEFHANIAAIEQAHADRCFPYQEEYDVKCEELRTKYAAEYQKAKAPLDTKIEKVRQHALRKINAIIDEIEVTRKRFQKQHDTHPVIQDATYLYKEATRASDEQRDIEVQPFWDEYQAKIAPIVAEYQEREKQLVGGSRLKIYKSE